MSSCVRSFLAICAIVSIIFTARPAIAGDAATQSMHEDMARLLPDDTFLVAYTPSLSKMTSDLTALVKEVSPQMAGVLMFMGPETLLKGAVNPQGSWEIRTDRPVAAAMVLGKTLAANPTPTFIFSVQGGSGEKFDAKPSQGWNMVLLEGTDLVALTMGETSTPKPAGTKVPALATNMMPGMLSVSFDQAMLRTKFGDALEHNIAEVFEEGNNASDPKIKAAIKKVNTEFASKIANGFDRWDYGANFDLTTPGFTLQYTPASPSWIMEPSPGLAAIGSHLASELPMQAVISKDMLNMLMSIGTMTMSAESDASLTTYLEQCHRLIDQIVGGVGMSASMSGDGMSTVSVCKVKDVKTFLADVDVQMKFLNDSKWGITAEAIPVAVGADTSRAFRVKIDMEEFSKMFPAEFGKANNSFAGGLLQTDGETAALLNTMQGPDGLVIRLISSNDWVATVVGDAKLLGTARRVLAGGAGNSPMLQRSLGMAYAEPMAGMSLDLRSLLIGASKFAKANPGIKGYEQLSMFGALPTSPPMPVFATASTTATANQFTMSLDMKALAAFIKDMQKVTQEASSADKKDKP